MSSSQERDDKRPRETEEEQIEEEFEEEFEQKFEEEEEESEENRKRSYSEMGKTGDTPDLKRGLKENEEIHIHESSSDGADDDKMSEDPEEKEEDNPGQSNQRMEEDDNVNTELGTDEVNDQTTEIIGQEEENDPNQTKRNDTKEIEEQNGGESRERRKGNSNLGEKQHEKSNITVTEESQDSIIEQRRMGVWDLGGQIPVNENERNTAERVEEAQEPEIQEVIRIMMRQTIGNENFISIEKKGENEYRVRFNQGEEMIYHLRNMTEENDEEITKMKDIIRQQNETLAIDRDEFKELTVEGKTWKFVVIKNTGESLKRYFEEMVTLLDESKNKKAKQIEILNILYKLKQIVKNGYCGFIYTEFNINDFSVKEIRTRDGLNGQDEWERTRQMIVRMNCYERLKQNQNDTTTNIDLVRELNDRNFNSLVNHLKLNRIQIGKTIIPWNEFINSENFSQLITNLEKTE